MRIFNFLLGCFRWDSFLCILSRDRTAAPKLLTVSLFYEFLLSIDMLNQQDKPKHAKTKQPSWNTVYEQERDPDLYSYLHCAGYLEQMWMFLPWKIALGMNHFQTMLHNQIWRRERQEKTTYDIRNTTLVKANVAEG